jgi:phosphotransferase system HPr (HPr) family protein
MIEPRASRQVVVPNPQGFHARAADLFVRLAMRYQSRIEIIKEGERVDGKGILHILTLGAQQGTSLTIEAAGDDAEAAVDALSKLIEQGFAEGV